MRTHFVLPEGLAVEWLVDAVFPDTTSDTSLALVQHQCIMVRRNQKGAQLVSQLRVLHFNKPSFCFDGVREENDTWE